MNERFEQHARVVAVALLALGCFLVIQPFLGAIIFAAILCFSTWPLFVATRERLGGRSWLTALLLALAVPIALAAQSMVVHASAAVDLVRTFLDRKSTLELPQFIVAIPF